MIISGGLEKARIAQKGFDHRMRGGGHPVERGTQGTWREGFLSKPDRSPSEGEETLQRANRGKRNLETGKVKRKLSGLSGGSP